MSGARREADNSISVEENDAAEGMPENRQKPLSAVGEQATNESQAKIGVRFAGKTAVGQIREHNEDNLVCADLTIGKLFPRAELCDATVNERGLLFAVCDGMGGAAAGEVASQMAVDMLFDALRGDNPPVDRDALARRLVAAVEQAGKRIFETAQADTTRRGMGTTVTATVLIDKVLFAAQVGDSRAYLLRQGDFKQITKDQSLVSQLIEAGHLTEKEAETFEHSNIILQALGTSESVQVDLSFAELRKGDRLMICSDGLSGMVDNDLVRESLLSIEDPNECCEKLIEHANAAGGHDNITVIVVDFSGDCLSDPKETDTIGYIEYPLLPSTQAEDRRYGGPDADEVTVSTMRPGKRNAARDTASDKRLVPKKRSAHLWLVIGVISLVAAGASLRLLSFEQNPRTEEATQNHNVKPATDSLPQTQQEEKRSSNQPAEAVASDVVNVRVRSDIEDANLHINGELRGPLSTSEDRIIGLRPGAYRFEARTSGNIAAVVVATVRPNTPLDISLTLPSGTTDPFREHRQRQRPRDMVDGLLRPRHMTRRDIELSDRGSLDLESKRVEPIAEKSPVEVASPLEQPAQETPREDAVSSTTEGSKKSPPVSEPALSKQEGQPAAPKEGRETQPDGKAPTEASSRIPDNPFE
ncbi:MAG: Stp1/IreP family PP2C-type Ser/Thr phosphatase [Deltaproteobacteria bacterium]|nr:Stp1/IreP family PP2C-type Ser/Thr phosphatase [Deltaproteobacteria bacterium]